MLVVVTVEIVGSAPKITPEFDNTSVVVAAPVNVKLTFVVDVAGMMLPTVAPEGKPAPDTGIPTDTPEASSRKIWFAPDAALAFVVKIDGKSELEGRPTTDIPDTKLDVSAMLKVIEPLAPAPGVRVVSIAFLT